MQQLVREIPPFIRAKWRSWRLYQELFGGLHLGLGSLSVGASSVIAANAASKFLTPEISVAIATLAAVAAFALTFLNAKQKNEAFEVAARELEKAMALYRADPAADIKTLAEAEVRGIELLNSRRPT